MALVTLRGPLPLKTHSPEWWLRRLLIKLHARRHELNFVTAFHDGQQPLMFASDEFNATFGARYRRLPANFMPRVVNAEKERLIVQGFRFGQDPRADKSVWSIWQRNQLDAESMIAHDIALVKSIAYTLVTPGDDGPEITIEDPLETMVESVAGNRRKRAAALKVWEDDDAKLTAYLFLPDWIYKFRSVKAGDETGWTAPVFMQGTDVPVAEWETLEIEGEDWPLENPLKVVPVVPLVNRPRRDGTGVSEIGDVMGNQNAINYLRFAALIGSDVAALPQRWAKNLEIPVVNGKDAAPFKTGKHTLWTTRRPTAEEWASYGDKMPDVEFGQFPQANLSPFTDMIREEVIEMAAISGTPYYQLVGPPTSVAPSGESIKSSEAALVKKSDAQAIYFGEGWEETMRLSLIADGQESKARADGETMWTDRETRNEAARTDSIIKQHTAGLLPDEFALEELGYSQQQILRIKELQEQERLEAPTPAPEPPPPEVVPDGSNGFQIRQVA
jgi:hypothetical protein